MPEPTHPTPRRNEASAPPAEPGTPEVSVVIPVRDGAATIGAQLEALAAQDLPARWEIVIADNGSTDGTAEAARAHAGRLRLPCALRVVRVDHAAGINVGRNGGIAAARGPVILLCDADDEVVPEWAAAHLAALADADLSGGPLDEVSLNRARIRALNAERSEGNPVACGFLPYAFGGNLGMRRAVWEALGGFDEAWVRGSTEVEFCWRAQLAGFRLAHAPDAVVRYRHRPTVGLELRRHYIAAKAPPRLYARFRRHGMPRTSTRAALRGWVWLVLHLPDLLRGGAPRAKWCNVATWRTGHLIGSLRRGVLYL